MTSLIVVHLQTFIILHANVHHVHLRWRAFLHDEILVISLKYRHVFDTLFTLLLKVTNASSTYVREKYAPRKESFDSRPYSRSKFITFL